MTTERQRRRTDIHILRIRYDKFGTFRDTLEHLIQDFWLRRLWVHVPQKVRLLRKVECIQYYLK
jgi:hypothetical protein